jgi:acetoacetyl-CoA reductase
MYWIPARLFEGWSESVEAACKSMIQIAAFTGRTIDTLAGRHAEELNAPPQADARQVDTMCGPLASHAAAVEPAPQSRTALVTGGIGGIGTAICTRLAALGHRVIATYLPAEAALAAEWKRQRAAEGYDIDVIECDVTDFESCAAMAVALHRSHGAVEILVNGAGITRDTTLHKMDKGAWDAVLDTNLDSVFNVTRNLIDAMVERGFGRIVNISSVNGQKGQFGQTNYSAAKAGMIGFTRSLARELADQGVTVNTVSPGYVATSMVMAVPSKILEGIISKVPVGRLAKPEEVAQAVAFLVAEDSGYITGSDLAVNGGLLMK